MSDAAVATEAPSVDSFTEFKLANGILTYGFFALIILGTISNIASLFVLRCKSFKKSSLSVSLSILSLVHLAVLFTPVLRTWIKAVFNIDVRITSGGCKLHVFLTYFLCHLASWTLTLIVIERALIVCFPLVAKPYVTRKNALIVWAVAVFFLVGLNFHFFFTFDYMPDPTGYKKKITHDTQTTISFNTTLSPTSNSTSATPVEYELECYSHQLYDHFFSSTWPWIDNVVLTILPFLFIFAGNLIILVVIRRALVFQELSHSRHHRKKLDSTHSRHNSRDGHYKGNPTHSTWMLLGTSVAFLLLTLPNGIYFILSSYIIQADSSPSKMAGYWLAYAVTSFLFYLGNSINFLVYYLTGSKFRKSFKECFSTNIFRSEAGTLEGRTLNTKF